MQFAVEIIDGDIKGIKRKHKMSRKRHTLKGRGKKEYRDEMLTRVWRTYVCVLHLRGIRLAREMIRALGITTCRDAQNLVTFSMSSVETTLFFYDEIRRRRRQQSLHWTGWKNGRKKNKVCRCHGKIPTPAIHTFVEITLDVISFFFFFHLWFFHAECRPDLEKKKLYNGTFIEMMNQVFIWFEFRLFFRC